MQIYDRRIAGTRDRPVTPSYFDPRNPHNRATGRFARILKVIGYGRAPETPQALALADR